jgi:RNA polymerase sigma-70 factor (ECF subfamily)
MPEDPDVALMLRVGQGDRVAFEHLLSKYQKMVIQTAFRYVGNPSVAEELAQDIFVRVFRAAPTYRPEARFTTWLFTIVRNVCANYRSRQGRYDGQMDSEIDPSIAIEQFSPEDDIVREETKIKVRKAVAALPETLRSALILHQFNHLSYDEIAKILNISLSAVKVRIHRARLTLMEELKELV